LSSRQSLSVAARGEAGTKVPVYEYSVVKRAKSTL
jgi:hypothetical protein